MALVERAMRLITCVGDQTFKGCGATAPRSPYGPASKWCHDCARAREESLHRERMGRVRRSSGVLERGPYRRSLEAKEARA